MQCSLAFGILTLRLRKQHAVWKCVKMTVLCGYCNLIIRPGFEKFSNFQIRSGSECIAKIIIGSGPKIRN